MKEFVRAVFRLIPDLIVEVQDLFATAAPSPPRLTLRGTLAATGAPITMTEIQMYRIAGGKIVERWYAVDGRDALEG